MGRVSDLPDSLSTNGINGGGVRSFRRISRRVDWQVTRPMSAALLEAGPRCRPAAPVLGYM